MQTNRPLSAPSLHGLRGHNASPQHAVQPCHGNISHPRRPPRPSTACPAVCVPGTARVHAKIPAGRGASTVSSPGALQEAHRPCGNVHGTGRMLRPVVPDPAGNADDERFSSLYFVSRNTPSTVSRRVQHIPQSTSSQLQQATLDVFVTDRLTGDAIVGATVVVAGTDSYSSGKVTNAGSTSAQSTKTNTEGRVTCRILAHRQCVLRKTECCASATTSNSTCRAIQVHIVGAVHWFPSLWMFWRAKDY